MAPIASTIPPHVVREHVLRLCELMRESEVAAVLLFDRANMLAFAGTSHGPWDRLTCGAVTRDGQVLVVCPEFERPAVAGAEAIATIHTWREHEDAYARLAEALRSAGVRGGVLGYDGRVWLESYERFRDACAFLTPRPAGALLREVRVCKSRAEQALLRAAQERGVRVFEALAPLMRPGARECDLHTAVAERMRAEGLSVDPMIQSGPNAAVPHNATGTRGLEAGDLVVVDSTVIVDGYYSDLTRTFAIGSAGAISPRARRAYRAVRDAQRAAIAAARPGVACETLDAIARRVIAEAGFGEHFTHRLGHGLGIECHEPPYLVGGNREPLRAGMYVTIEPGVYVPGEFGVRIEDDVLITENGCQVLSSALATDLSPELD
ncbi:MAG: Xaa-Pro peptidase family protein [Phycisphaerae bacterium]|jgi:Xaa-Pro dipeptidase|nr:aminopeptidase P family protein [Phycisphaerae bacterium]MCZ2400188.1 Xaa-Pro peptidase family protein [Phycisphaerae bacterium]